MAEPRKVIIAASEFPPLPGGIGNHAFNLADQLNQRDFDVTVISNARGKKSEELQLMSGELPGVKLDLIGRSNPLSTYIKRLRALRKHVAGLRSGDALFLSGKFWVICAQWLTVKKGIRIFAVIHGTEISHNPVLLSKGLRRCDKVICVSSFTMNRLIEHYPESADKAMVINNGHGMKALTKAVIRGKDDPVTLVTVGNVHPRKGQNAVIKLLPDLADQFPGISYHVIGIPTHQEEFTALALRLGVADRVKFYGQLPYREMREKLAEMDVFVMLSQELANGDFEGFGIAILEANALGVPAIGSRNSGIEDAISDGVNGFLADHDNPVEVSRAIRNILNDYEHFSNRSIEWAGKFHWNVVGMKYEDLINTNG